MLNWANRFNICCFLDSHQYQLPFQSHECILAAGTLHQVKANAGNAFEALSRFCSRFKDWVFGHLGYDLKNELEQLQSAHIDLIQLPDLFFFVPEVVILLEPGKATIELHENRHEKIWSEITSTPAGFAADGNAGSVQQVLKRFSREEYLDTVSLLRQHILRGDCYEINFCQEFYLPSCTLDPLSLYSGLTRLSPNPFSAYYKHNDVYLVCASPERYLRKSGEWIFSQPIKGTSERNLKDPDLDRQFRESLAGSEKDRSENVMVVDLVRNDLSRICMEGSVMVEELFGIYSFPQVHQMISTIKGRLKPELSFADMVRATFPMGSMTGAPKKRVMELIERYERTRRGLFSGAVGYINPDQDFDFNVVIRSILLNTGNQYLSFQVGSGITYYSDPQKEYLECELKASAIKKLLAGKT